MEIEGSILYVSLDEQFAEKFSAAKRQNKYSVQELEDSFNRLDTSYVFNPGLMEGLEDEDDLLFAKCVAEAWRGRLCLLYPTRKFQISILSLEESGDGHAICFHEIRTESN